MFEVNSNVSAFCLAGYFADDTTREWVSKLKSTTVEQRPSTADAHGSPTSKADRLPMRQAGVSQLLVARPTTGAPNSYLPPSAGPRISAQGRFSEPAVASILEPLKRDDVTAAISSSSGSKSSSSNSRYGTKSNDKYVNSSSSSSRSSSRFDYGLSETDLVVCRKVAIRIDTTWGDDNYTGAQNDFYLMTHHKFIAVTVRRAGGSASTQGAAVQPGGYRYFPIDHKPKRFKRFRVFW